MKSIVSRVFVVALICAGGVFACDGARSVPEFSAAALESGECEDGDVRCSNNGESTMVCEDGSWTVSDCPSGEVCIHVAPNAACLDYEEEVACQGEVGSGDADCTPGKHYCGFREGSGGDTTPIITRCVNTADGTKVVLVEECGDGEICAMSASLDDACCYQE